MKKGDCTFCSSPGTSRRRFFATGGAFAPARAIRRSTTCREYSPMPLTLISHFWNEEFLLPFWLKHHVPLFNHGILLDYASTDRSREIIQEFAPRWEVRPSRNAWFDAQDADAEVMEIERCCEGWKIVLNTTEFLLCEELPLFVQWMEKYRPDVTGIWP